MAERRSEGRPSLREQQAMEETPEASEAAKPQEFAAKKPAPMDVLQVLKQSIADVHVIAMDLESGDLLAKFLSQLSQADVTLNEMMERIQNASTEG